MKKRYVMITMLIGALSIGSLSSAAQAEASQVMEDVTTENTAEETELYTWGDAVDTTQEELKTKMEEALKNVSSVKSELAMDMELFMSMKGEASETGMQMSMTAQASMVDEQTFDPYAVHRTETVTFEVLGQSQVQRSESYVRIEDGSEVTYQRTSDGETTTDWDRDVTDTAEESYSFVGESGVFDELPEMELAEQKAVDAEGGEYYVMEAHVNLNEELEEEGFAEEVKELMDTFQESFGGEGLALPEDISMNIYVGTEDFLPVEILMDLSGIKGTMDVDGMEGTALELEFTRMLVRYLCSDYNEISEIAFPEELSSAAAETENPEVDTEENQETKSPESETEGNQEAGETEESSEPLSLAEELGVSGIKETTDTSVAFTANGTVESPAGMNEMGKVYTYNSNSDMYEQVGLQVTGITGGEEAAEYVDELLNADGSYYSFNALKNNEEYRVLDYDIYLPADMTDSEYGIYSPYSYFEVLGTDGDWLEIGDDIYFSPIYPLYEDEGEYHPGMTAHCKTVFIMPKDCTEYLLEFGPYGLEYFNVLIQQ